MTPEQQWATLIAGILAPIIIQFIKNWLGWSGKPALWLAFGSSIGIAIAAYVLTGKLAGIPWGEPVAAITAILQMAAGIFALATLIYKQFFPMK